MMDERRPGRDLSEQELVCLKLLFFGQAEHELAKDLGLNPDTVTTYLETIYRKLGTKTRTHALAVAIYEGIVGVRRID